MQVVRMATSGTASRKPRAPSRGWCACRSGRRMRSSTASRRVLDRHVEVRHDARLRGDDLEQPRRDAGGVQVHVAGSTGCDVSRSSASSSSGSRGAVASQVAAVVRQVLRDEVDLARALQLEQLRLAHDVVERERAVLAAHQRDGAEGAAVVAALADLEVAHVRRVARVLAHAGMRVDRIADAARARASSGTSRSRLGRAEEEVHLGQRVLQLGLVALDHAAHRDHRAGTRRSSLQPAGLDDRVDRLLLGRVDEAAGVDEDRRRRREASSTVLARRGRRSSREVALGVDGVLVAAQRDDGRPST